MHKPNYISIFLNRKSFSYRIFSLLIFLLIWGNQISAQNQWGIISSNYAGIQSVYINPANIVNQPFDVDVNVVSTGMGINNNSYYLPKANIPQRLMNNNLNIRLGARDTAIYTTDGKYRHSLVRDVKDISYVMGELLVMGPSILINRRNSAFAITTSLRNYVSLTNSNYNATYTFYDGLNMARFWDKKIDLNSLHVGFLSWYEVGFTKAKVLKENFKYMLKGGASGKLLLGLSAGGFYDRGTEAYYRPNTTMEIRNADFTLAYSLAKDDPDERQAYLPRGYGLGLDVGLVILRKGDAVRKFDYCPNVFGYFERFTKNKWRLGVSLLDFGFIYFNHQTKKTNYQNFSHSWIKQDTLYGLDLVKIERTFTGIYSNLPGANITSTESFMAFLPTCISAQADARLIWGIYMNATWIQRIPYGNTVHARRMNTLAFTPRFESRWLEVSFPVRLIEYQQLAFGAALKVRYFYIGSDRIFEMFGYTKQIWGADFYMGIKFNFNRKIGSGGSEY